MIWNCSGLDAPRYEVFKEKSLLAEEKLPTDIVQIPYATIREDVFHRIKQRGFDVWGCFAGTNAERMKDLHRVLLQNNANGILLANWIPCIEDNRDRLIDTVNQFKLI